MAEKKIEWTFDKVSASHLTYMRLAAFIPFKNRDLTHLGTQLLSVYCHLINFLYNTMFSGYGVRMALDRRFEVDYISEMMVVESICFRYLLIYLRRADLVKLVERCERLWSYLVNEEKSVVRSFERNAHYFRTFMLVDGLLVTSLFIVTDYFVKRAAAAEAVAANETLKKSLTFRFYVEVSEEPMFTFVYILQLIVCYTIPCIIPCVETVGLYLIMMACGYLRVVRNRLVATREPQKLSLETTSDVDIQDRTLNKVLMCAKFHQDLMQFCEEIESLTRSIFFISAFSTIYNTSITGLKILEKSEDSYKYISLLCLILFQFFTVQWAPEFLLNESEAIGHAAYVASLEHANFQKRTHTILYLIMLRAQRPIQLTAGGYMRLSMETFGAMMKSAFSFFAVLRSFGG